MNLLLLAIAFRAWTGSALSVFLRFMAAVATFSVEMQLATWLQAGTLPSMRLVNLAAAAASVLWFAARRRHQPHADTVDQPAAFSSRPPVTGVRLPPSGALLALGLIVVALAVTRPVLGADAYHLHRVDLVTRSGTLAYDPAAADVKINALAGVYELLLADLRIPGMATALVRLHGVLGLGLYVLVVAVVASMFPVRRRWMLAIFLVVPVVFHQFVYVKNDLFGGMPALVALAWVVTRGRELSMAEAAAAAGLAGVTVGIKISSAPVALVVAGFIAFDHRGHWRMLVTAIAAGLAGAVAGGLLFTLLQNAVVYGGVMQPYGSLNNRNTSAGEAMTGIARFAISLFDLGLITRRVWPGRGGWGSTFGLPFVWAIAVLALNWRTALVRRAVLAAGVCFLVFAAAYPDADLAHRMVIGPGLLLIAAAIACADREERGMSLMRAALVPVVLLSAVQVGHSAMLYLAQR